jgi:hypothetical protein
MNVGRGLEATLTRTMASIGEQTYCSGRSLTQAVRMSRFGCGLWQKRVPVGVQACSD